MSSIEQTKIETRTNINKRFAIGLSAEEVRKEELKDLQHLHDIFFAHEFSQIAFSVEHALNFALRINTVIGVYNDVLFKEFGMTPVHISELLSTVVSELENYYEMSIDEIFNRIIEFGEGGIH